jgi:hypothetical protein
MPWEGGVYSMNVVFSSNSLERIPKCDFAAICVERKLTDFAGRFFRLLFHLNVFPSGT